MAFPIDSTGFSDALVILGAAGVVIPAFARLRISPVIGFILVGMAVGPAGLGRFVPQAPWLYHVTITDPHAIEPFAEFGIVLLLFSIGLELSFARLWSMRQRVFGLGAAELIGCGVILAALFRAGGTAGETALGLGFALALSSTALVLPMAGTSGPVGQRAFAMLLFEDLALVPIIFALGVLAPQHGEGGTAAAIGRTLLVSGAVIGVMLVAGRLALPRLFAQAARTKSPELFLAASLLVVILASIATTAAGLSPIVGALLAGILIAETDYHGEVELITAPFKGLALGVFLITVGMSLNFDVIAAQWLPLLAAIVAVVAIKAAVTILLLRVGGTRQGVALETGLMMAAPSETTLIVLAAASAAGLIVKEAAAFWEAVTAIGLTITPLLALAGRRLARRVDQAAADEPAEAGDDQRALIIGFGRVGRLVAQMLAEHHLPYLALDADPDTVERARERGYSVAFGDIARPGMIAKLAFERASAVVLTMDDPVQTVHLTRTLRAQFPDLTIIARARDPNHAAALYKVGATDAVPETIESSLQLSEAVLCDLGLAVGPVIASIHEKRAQLRTKIMEMAELARAPLLRRPRAPEEV